MVQPRGRTVRASALHGQPRGRKAAVVKFRDTAVKKRIKGGGKSKLSKKTWRTERNVPDSASDEGGTDHVEGERATHADLSLKSDDQFRPQSVRT